MLRYFFLLLLPLWMQAQKNSKLLDSIIKSNPLLKKVILNKAKYRPQIIYTQINRSASGIPVFKSHTYFLDSTSYFYCASLVKLPCSVFALEKLNSGKVNGLNRSAPMLTDSSNICQKKNLSDTTSANGYPSVEHYIKKMLLVSDNFSYSRVFEFVTPRYIALRMAALGHRTARIVHRFDAPCIGKGNKHFNTVRFVDENGGEIYTQQADSLKEEFTPPLGNMVIGRNKYNKRKRLISEKKDFSHSNYLSLQMIHEFLRKLVFDEFNPSDKRFNLSGSDRDFIMRHLGMYPRESQRPRYNAGIYHDSFKKYFIYGGVVKTIEVDSLRVFNIVGRAYGFTTDCAYIVDLRTGIEFMLSAVIYTNNRNSFGSGKYEYDTVGLPFLKELSLALYSLESRRKKKHLPDLKSLDFYRSTN